MGHLCGASCKRKSGVSCETYRTSGKGKRVVVLDGNGKPVNPATPNYPHATPHEIGAAVDIYFNGLSYRRTAESVEQYFGRETNPATVYRWVHGLTEKADDIAKSIKVNTGDVWVADELDWRQTQKGGFYVI